MIFTQNCYSFDPNPQSCKYGYLTPRSKYSVEQVPLSLVIILDETRYKKVSHGHVCVFQLEAGYEPPPPPPLNSSSVSME